MEELKPPKPKQKWRHWLKPIVFTTLLYVGLGGVAYYFYGATPTQSTTKNTTTSLTNERGSVVATVSEVQPVVIQEATSDSALTTTPQEGVNVPVVVLSPQNSNTPSSTALPLDTTKAQNGRIVANLNQTRPQVAPNAQQNTASIPSNNEAVAPSPEPTISAPSEAPKSKALTKAEEEAEAQNELLREAINKVRQLNDNKIAKSRENTTESSVPAHQPIIKDESDEAKNDNEVVQKEQSAQKPQPKKVQNKPIPNTPTQDGAKSDDGQSVQESSPGLDGAKSSDGSIDDSDE